MPCETFCWLLGYWGLTSVAVHLQRAASGAIERWSVACDYELERSRALVRFFTSVRQSAFAWMQARGRKDIPRHSAGAGCGRARLSCQRRSYEISLNVGPT